MGVTVSGRVVSRVGSPMHMFWGLRWVVVAVALMSSATHAETLHCRSGNVLVHAANARDAETVCEGAGDAVGFLAGIGLDVAAEIQVQVVEQLPPEAGSNAAGCYVRSERYVYVPAATVYDRQKAGRGGALGLIPYRSLIAHEMAHAIADNNFAVPRPTIQAHEYIASVTMFSTMPVAERASLLDMLPGDGFDAEEQISATLYLLAPHWFAAQSFRHYNRKDNGPAFLRRVLAGHALSEQQGR